MEQNIGSIGTATETYSKGVATVAVGATLPPTSFGLALGVQVNGSIDAKILIDYLAAKIGGPVPAEVAAFLTSALAIS